MHHFAYKNGLLHAENVALPRIAKEVGTPFYCYSRATFTRHVNVLQEALAKHNPLICYAMKANSNQAILTLIQKLGCGVDIVSKGELMRALKAGFAPEKIVYSGVGKKDDEISMALEVGIHCFNVESQAEFERIGEIATDMDKIAPISFRVNPDVDAKTTNRRIATGKKENKFGIAHENALALYQQAHQHSHIQVVGIDMHIGSQITDFTSYDEAMDRLVSLAKEIIANGISLEHIDFGGGIGIPYHKDAPTPPEPKDFAKIISKHMDGLNLNLVIEPGRVIAGNAGIMVSEIIFVKESEPKRFYIVDGAMNDLIRPTLYEAHHDILPVKDLSHDHPVYEKVDVVGPVCESGDFLAENREMPQMQRGDLIAVMSAGAYGAVQSGTYNSRPLIPEVLVDGDQYYIIRKRMEVEDIIALDHVPDIF